MNTDPIEDRKRVAELPQVRDVFGYAAAVAEDAAELATRRYEYALEQRDRLNERIRFGSLTLNAASLLALASLIGSEDKLSFLELSKAEIVGPVVLFGLGLAFGALAIWSNGIQYIDLSVEAFKFRISAVHRKALFQSRISETAEDGVSEELSKAPVSAPDFAFSTRTIWLTNFSGAFWLGGLSVIISAFVCRVAT